ncbi:MAG: ubiquitin-like small modifier protein 2 [Haloplanus sp.]
MPTVRAEVVGDGVETVDLAPDATYGDVLAALGLSSHEAAVLVDDSPVPEDRPVDADVDRVRVLRLVKGGAGSVRPADSDDYLDVMRVLDGAALSADAATVRDRIGRGEVLVATRTGGVVGTLVRDGNHVTAVAVRRRVRGQGVGTALVSAALADRGRLTAAFDPDVRPFYESLGFDIAATDDDDRLRGRIER